MKIWTNVTSEEISPEPMRVAVADSYTCKERAAYVLFDIIVARIEEDPDFARSVWNDENHSDFKDYILGNEAVSKILEDDWVKGYFVDRSKERMRIPAIIKNAAREYIMDELRRLECYFVCITGGDVREYSFRIMGNNLEVL